jgi:transposase
MTTDYPRSAGTDVTPRATSRPCVPGDAERHLRYRAQRVRTDDVPPWQTVSHSVRRWQRDETWGRIHAALRTDVRVAAGREAAPSAAILDRQSVTTTENGGRTGLMLATTSTDAHAICW